MGWISKTDKRAKIGELFLEKIDNPQAHDFTQRYWAEIMGGSLADLHKATIEHVAREKGISPEELEKRMPKASLSEYTLDMFNTLIIFMRVLKFHKDHYNNMSNQESPPDTNDDQDSNVITIAPPEQKFYPPIDNFAEKADRAALVEKNIGLILEAILPFMPKDNRDTASKKISEETENQRKKIFFDKNIKFLKPVLQQIDNYFRDDLSMLTDSRVDLEKEIGLTGDPTKDLSKLLVKHKGFIARTNELIQLSDTLIDFYDKKKSVFEAASPPQPE